MTSDEQPPGGASAPHDHPPPSNLPPLVLVVEDDPDLGSLLEHVLSGDGYTVLLATDGQEGLYLYRELAPDVMILDVMMPRLSGFEILRELQARGELRATSPVLVLTARASEKDVVTGFGLGASDYLTKPFMIAELRARVRGLLGKQDRPAGDTSPESSGPSG